MDTRCIVLGVVLFVAGFGLGFAANNIFNQSSSGILGTQLSIGEIEWSLVGDSLTMHIPIDNVGTVPVTIQTISVRKNATGSTEYSDLNPTGIFSGSDSIAPGGSDTFEWNATLGLAPFDFLLPGNTYVIKVIVYDGYYQRTTTAPFEWA